MMYQYYGDWAGYNMVGGFFMMFFWIAVIFFIIWIIKNTINAQHGGHKEKTALDIIKERYAKGEIDQKEFETKKKDITNRE